MKPQYGYLRLPKGVVAPRAGAWVETLQTISPNSLPPNVAPRAGAWVETHAKRLVPHGAGVAPRAGAWVETWIGSDQNRRSRSRTPCGCVG